MSPNFIAWSISNATLTIGTNAFGMTFWTGCGGSIISRESNHVSWYAPQKIWIQTKRKYTYKQLLVTSAQSKPQYRLVASPTNNPAVVNHSFSVMALGEVGLFVVGADVGDGVDISMETL